LFNRDNLALNNLKINQLQLLTCILCRIFYAELLIQIIASMARSYNINH